MVSSSTNAPPSRLKRGALIGAATVLLVLAAAYVAGYFLTGERVPSGTTVAGVDIGGMSAAEAEATLEDELADESAAPIVLTFDGTSYEIEPAEVGLGLDTEQTVLAAGGGRSWNPVRMVELLTGPENAVEPVVEVDEAALEAAISDLAAEVDQAPAEPAVSYTRKGELEVTQPVDGVTVDQQATAALVTEAYLGDPGPREIPVSTTSPDVTADELDTMISKVAEPAVSGPITLELPGRSVALRVRDFAPSLRLSIDNGRLVPSIDEGKLERGLADVIGAIGEQPQDATVVLRGGTPVVVPAKPGVTLDASEVAEAILPVLTETGEARSAEVGTATARPDFTTAEARDLGIRERVSDFVTYFPYAEYRNTNQGRAAELINGTVLRPGEIFSFNDTVGERTEANGFVSGFIISNGVYGEDLGGGVSQVVTTTYNAAFFAGLKDIEHKPHSFYIDRYPLGREATVAWPTVDLKFQNDTPYGILIHAWVVPSTPSSQGEMHVEMFSTKYWDIEAGVSERYNFTAPTTRYSSAADCYATTGYSGFDVDVFRTFREPGSSEVVRKETQSVTYIPLDTVICSSPPSSNGGAGDGAAGSDTSAGGAGGGD